jgi:pyruvate carboxylase subunit B
MARKLLGESVHLRLHTHETAGVSVACYLAALEAGVDGIDLAASPVSGGTSQPDILTMLHAVKGKDFDLGGLELEKILTYQEVLKDNLKDYFMPPEATQVSPLIPFSPMPGGALTANTQMLRDNNILEKFPEIIKAMREVVEKGGYGTSVTPVSQFYFQQAFNNVMFGKWNKIAEGYGKMVLGYFGHTPTAPDSDIVSLASEQLKMEPTTKNAIDIADADETKSLKFTQNILEKEGLKVNDENLFIAASCKEKGIAFLKGEAKVNVRKIDKNAKQESVSVANSNGEYTVVVNGERFNVQVSEGLDASIEVKSVTSAAPTAPTATIASGLEITASLPGSVFKVVASVGDSVKEGDVIVILEAMKMEIEIVAPKDGVVSSVDVSEGQTVENGQLLATI